jgi:ABC-type glutathione transport system ATPase component
VSVLRFEEVVKQYADVDEVVRAVDRVSFSIEPGEVLALYGPSAIADRVCGLRDGKLLLGESAIELSQSPLLTPRTHLTQGG